jgi:hypothetical protein
VSGADERPDAAAPGTVSSAGSERPDTAAAGAGAPGGTSAGDVQPYLRLAELAEAELVACQEERPEILAPYYEEAQRIIELLPPRPPASAAEALHRAAGAQRQIEDLLSTKLVMAEGDLDHLRRGREAARAYATTAAAFGR